MWPADDGAGQGMMHGQQFPPNFVPPPQPGVPYMMGRPGGPPTMMAPGGPRHDRNFRQNVPPGAAPPFVWADPNLAASMSGQAMQAPPGGFRGPHQQFLWEQQQQQQWHGMQQQQQQQPWNGAPMQPMQPMMAQHMQAQQAPRPMGGGAYWMAQEQPHKQEGYGGESRNNGHYEQHRWQSEQQQQAAPKTNGYGAMWENPKAASSSNEWNGGGRPNNGATQQQQQQQPSNQWVNPQATNGGDRSQEVPQSSRVSSSSRYDPNPSAVGPWNPSEGVVDMAPPAQGDMMWRDPNPKQKKVQRDIGTSVWGDPSQQKQISYWMRPENAPPDFEWTKPGLGSGSSSVSQSAVFGWNDPIPADRARGSTDLERNIASADSAATMEVVSNQLRMAVDKGILSPSVLSRPLPPQSLIELNDLLRCMSKLEQLQVEKIRVQQNGGGQYGIPQKSASAIDAQIQLTQVELDRLRSNIAKDEDPGGCSKLLLWKRAANDSSVEGILQQTSRLAVEDRANVSDWLEASDGLGEPLGAHELVEGPQEFIPGKQWQWRDDPSKIAQDPNITPGQCKPSPLVTLKVGEDGVHAYEQWSEADQGLIAHEGESTVWMTFPHNGQIKPFYEALSSLTRIAHFVVVENICFVRFPQDAPLVEIANQLTRQFPNINGQVSYMNDDQMRAEHRRLTEGPRPF